MYGLPPCRKPKNEDDGVGLRKSIRLWLEWKLRARMGCAALGSHLVAQFERLLADSDCESAGFGDLLAISLFASRPVNGNLTPDGLKGRLRHFGVVRNSDLDHVLKGRPCARTLVGYWAQAAAAFSKEAVPNPFTLRS